MAVTDDARAGLVSAVVERGDANGDRVRHALALFRAREASEHDKRSAIVTLDWVFWWYLATVELSDRLIERTDVTPCFRGGDGLPK